MAELIKLVHAIQAFPSLHVLDTSQLLLFIEICCHLRPEFDLLPTNNPNLPPIHLPSNIHTFLARCILSSSEQEQLDLIGDAWTALNRIIWQTGFREAGPSVLPLFLHYGPALKLSWRAIGPPTVTCTYAECPKLGSSLTNRKQYPATLFTRNEGPIPIFPSHLYCEGCRTTYHTNYYIHSRASARTYYDFKTPPSIIQISQRMFMEETLCELFAVMMTMSWTSATNCARVYNLSMGDYSRKRQNKLRWKGMQMEMEHVWNGFFLHALILDAIRQQSSLILPNDEVHHSERYSGALHQRNEVYKGPARPMWNHICNLCSRVVLRNGIPVLIRAAVVDGVTIGHPCCAVHDCMEPLPSKNIRSGKPRYCETHQQLEHQCAVTTCDRATTGTFKTCDNLECRKLEERYTATGGSMFQLKERLARNRERLTGKSTLAPFQGAAAEALKLATGPDDAMEAIEDDDEVELEMEVDDLCDGKERDSRSKLKARFGRRRTHNDELCVYTCGMIAGRTAMYGSEAPNGVRTFLHNLFPTVESLPSYIFHDNNCQLRKMLDRSFPHDRLHRIAMPVDVFHFWCKHKEGDEYCATHCNPANFVELMHNGKWVFNSSAAEQANAWIGGFLAIVREMRAERYNFFLDEMVRRRNEWLFEELEEKGHKPRYLDYNVVLKSILMDE